MSNPTVGIYTSDQISNSTSVPALSNGQVNLSNYTYSGCAPTQRYNSGPLAVTVANAGLTSSNSTPPCFIDCWVDSSQFEVAFVGQGLPVRILVDGQEVSLSGPDTNTGTAQAGSSSTITLASGASATDGIYVLSTVFITSGTGSGQSAIITAYNGSTKVATIQGTWTTNPDATSVYRVNPCTAPFSGPTADSAAHYILVNYGVRATRHVRLELSCFSGLYVDPSGSVTPYVFSNRSRVFVIGDSYSMGTGTSDISRAYSYQLANLMGCEFWILGSEGTGLINPLSANGRFNYTNRILPSYNSWTLNTFTASGGTFTVSQGSITSGAVAYNASAATLQTALDSAFGTGAFFVGNQTFINAGYVIVGQGEYGSNTQALTVSYSGGSGSITASRFVGDIAANLPVDDQGNKVPFYVFVQGSVNDDSYAAQVQQAAQQFLVQLQNRFPQAQLVVMGRSMEKSPETASACQVNAAWIGNQSYLRKINGQSPFVQLFDPLTGLGLITGAYNTGNQTSSGGNNSSLYVYYDGIHPTTYGHQYLANQIYSRMTWFN